MICSHCRLGWLLPLLSILLLVAVGVLVSCSDSDESPTAPLPGAGVQRTVPVAGATDISIYSELSITFDRPIDSTSLSASSVALSPAAEGALVLDDTTLAMVPTWPLAPNKDYTITVSGLKNRSGTAIAPYSWTFKTRPHDQAWSKTFGGTSYPTAVDAVELDNGNVLLLGTCSPGSVGGYDFYLLEIDLEGNERRSASFGTSGDDRATELVRNAEGYLLLGKTTGGLYMVQLDTAWEVLWSKTGAVSGATNMRVTTSDNGGWFIAYETDETPPDPTILDDTGERVTVAEIGPNGDRLWTTVVRIGNNNCCGVGGVLDVPGAGYRLLAYKAVDWDNWDSYALWIGTDGAISRIVRTADPGAVGEDDYLNAACIIDGGGFVAAGGAWTQSGVIGAGDIYIARMGANIGPVWKKVLTAPGEQAAAGIAQAPDGGFVVATWRYFGMYKFDANGNYEWGNSWGGYSDWGAKAIGLVGGGYLLVGCSASLRNAWVVKTKLDGTGP